MKKLMTIILIVAGAALSLISGCAKQGREIRVGVMAPLTGDVASWGEMQRRSTELALIEENAVGGVDGKRIVAVYEDDRVDPKTGVNAFRKLADVDRVPIVVGSPASNVTLAVAPIANEKEVVLLSSGSTATEVKDAGPYVFRIMPSDEVQASIMAEWTLELGFRNVAIVYVENSWGRGLMEAFRQDLRKRGGNIVTVQASDQAETDFRAQLSKVQASRPDVIYAPLYTKGAGLMAKQARELGLNQQILGADVYGTPELVEAGGEAVEGILYTSFQEYHGPEYQDFLTKYEDRYGLTPETYAVYCYDAMKIAIEAMRRIPAIQSVSGSSIREALLSIEDYHGATGLTSFSGNTNASGKTFEKMMVKDGKFVRYSK